MEAVSHGIIMGDGSTIEIFKQPERSKTMEAILLSSAEVARRAKELYSKKIRAEVEGIEIGDNVAAYLGGGIMEKNYN